MPHTRNLRIFFAVALAYTAGIGAITIAGDGIRAFDFGPARGPVADGFVQVTAASRYGRKAGFGFTCKGQHEDMTCVVHAGPLTIDRIINPGTFQVDLPDGQYRVAIITGNCTRVYVKSHIHQALINSHWIRHGKRQVYARPMDMQRFFAPDGPYFASSRTFYRPGQSLWQRYGKRWFPLVRFQVKVQEGALKLTFSRNFSLQAMVVFPADRKAAGEAFIARMAAKRQRDFDGAYVRVPAVREQPPFAATFSQQKTGMVLFARHPMLPVFPETVPAPHEAGAPAQGFSARGSCVILQAGCVPVRDLGELSVTLSGLDGPSRIPASAIRILYARYAEFMSRDKRHYTLKPKLLVRRTRVPGSARVARAFYIFVNIPLSARPGTYTGRIIFHASAGQTEAGLPLRVRVLPFSLPESDVYTGAYYSFPSGTTFRAFYYTGQYKQQVTRMTICKMRAQFALMRELGLNYVSSNTKWKPFTSDESGRITINPDDYKLFVATGDAVRDAGFKAFSFFGIGWSVLMNYCPGWLGRKAAAKMPMDRIRFPDKLKIPAAALIKKLYAVRTERKWPPMLFYVSDELGNMGIRGRTYGRELTRFLKNLKPDLPRDFTTIASSLKFKICEEMLPNLDRISPNLAWPLNPVNIAAARKAGCELWTYNLGTNRLAFGYYMWRAGVRGHRQWTFDWNCTAPDPFCGLTCDPSPIDSAIAPDWQAVPSYMWGVVFREGIADYRYLQLLRNLIRQHPDTPAAHAGARVVEELKSRVSVTYLDPVNSWHPGTHDYFRWKISAAIMRFGQ